MVKSPFKNKLVWLIIIFFIVFFSSIALSTIQLSNPKKNIEKLRLSSQNNIFEEWFKESKSIQSIENSGFNDSSGWILDLEGDTSDVTGIIESGKGNFQIFGEKKENYEIISGTINNSQTSKGWKNASNPLIPVYPRRIASRPLHNITEQGCWTSHIWNESSGTPLNPFQKVSVQWDKNVSLSDDMSDYIITSATLQVEVNATVRAYPGEGKDPYEPPYPWGGIETYGDFYNTYFGEGDYIVFYIVLSNLEKNVSYRVAEFKPPGLGTDVGQNPYDNLTDTIFEPDDMEDLIFYLNQVISSDNHNFTLSLGIEINCEDNIVSDMDIFEEIYIKTCDFNISYVKKIDQLSQISWKYQAEQIDDEGGIVEITESRLYFKYSINKIWTTQSPNSEIRIYINDQEFSDTIKLSEALTIEKNANIDGFRITNLIPSNTEINLTIQTFIGDEFGLNETYVLSIDDVLLEISYDIFRPAEETFIFQLMLVLSIAASILIGSYLVYYIKIGRFPKPVRKVRKYRKTLNQNEAPKDLILDRKWLLKGKYRKNLRKSEGFLESRSKMNRKPQRSKNEIGKSSKKNLLIILLLLINMFITLPLLNMNSIKRDFQISENHIISLSSTDAPSALIREPRTVQWISNSQFDVKDNWKMNLQGDTSDLNASLRNEEALFSVIGNNGSQTWIENDALSGDWLRIENSDDIPRPEVSQLTPNGWFVQHQYVDNNLNQSVKVQWQKNFTLDVDMADYYITSASLEAWVNGTVQAMNADDGGIDRPGDTAGSGLIQIATGDFARFFLMISDLDRDRSFRALEYQTNNLGRDGSPAVTELNDTLLIPINEDTLIFYLNEVLKKNSTEFAVVIGIYVWCEDSVYAVDRDYWNGLWFKNFTLSFTYQKKIDQFNTISWEYNGNELENENYDIEITKGRLSFDYKIDQSWVTNVSPNSEIKMFINNQEHNETVKLSTAELTFKDAKDGGFDVTKLIPEDQEINVSLQVFIADEFGLDNPINISIDNVELLISYNLLIPIEDTLIIPIAAWIITAFAIGLGGYFIVYQRVLKYPKQVRKVRKYKRTLNREKDPDLTVIERKISIKSSYQDELKDTKKFLKGKDLAKINKTSEIRNSTKENFK